MNRIQQILSKAEHDGTARRITPAADDRPSNFAGAVSPAPPVIERSAAIGYAEPISRPAPAPFINREDSRVSHAEPAPLAAPVVAHEPHEAREAREARQAREAQEAQEAQQATKWTIHRVLAASSQPNSSAAEQYRSLRSRITQAENGHSLRVIQVTSPSKGDGKTVTALNLALTMAQEYQQRIAIVDCDLRQPQVHALLGLPPGPGLADVLAGIATLDDALIHLPDQHLTVLRAGRAQERPAELLGSGAMRRIVDALRTQFDRVIVDSAPTQVADPGAMAQLADGLLVVVRAGRTTRPAITHALETLPAAKILGLVFNESGTAATYSLAATA
jgi:non-specific protein-tyrosine kinase